MTLCNLQRKSDENSFIDVYNWGDFIIRYNGVYFVGEFGSRFCTFPIFPLDHIKTTFPDDAHRVEFFVQFWSDSASTWINFSIINKSLPGSYCFRSAGTLQTTRFDEILCP